MDRGVSDPDICAWCFAETQGNPHYLRHVLQALLDRGIVVWQGETLRVAAEMNVATFTDWLSESLRGLLLDRVQPLDAVTPQVLVAASPVRYESPLSPGLATHARPPGPS